MLISVGTTNDTLEGILSAGQEAVALSNIDGKGVNSSGIKTYDITIQVLGAPDVYVDFGQAAAVVSGYKMITNDKLTFTDVNLSDCNLIADTTLNSNVRVLIN